MSKANLLLSTGLLGTFVTNSIGGWDTAIQTLLIFMLIDYITGITCATFYSCKSTKGGLKSSIGFAGLFKKCTILLMVLVGYRMDMAIGTQYIRDGIVIAYSVNELVSIIENVGIMGVPIPEVLKRAIEIFRKGIDTNKDGDKK